MRLMGAVSHAIVDYVLVILLFIGPSVAGFAGRQATWSYFFGAMLLALALVTRYPLGLIRSVRFPLHGALEFVLGILMLILPWLANFSRGVLSRNFYILMALLILIICAITDFRGRGPQSGGRGPTPKEPAPTAPR